MDPFNRNPFATPPAPPSGGESGSSVRGVNPAWADEHNSRIGQGMQGGKGIQNWGADAFIDGKKGQAYALGVAGAPKIPYAQQGMTTPNVPKFNNDSLAGFSGQPVTQPQPIGAGGMFQPDPAKAALPALNTQTQVLPDRGKTLANLSMKSMGAATPQGMSEDTYKSALYQWLIDSGYYGSGGKMI